ncbi:thioesterase family protein [Cryptosporangium phraense]|uniref:Thioesterase family protein n=1 Tax=Cryptosporangium phraense TaxID=2593070 RepID=A0A545AMV8_9ACTN|nr:thioesterase family protein [Cryptosporangium phraense]TQS42669.1 thioesterase family protein [Cryptosporangium phraense]
MTTKLDETWLGFAGVHGGVLLAALLRTATDLVPGTPATVTAHYFAPVRPDEVVVDATVVHPGRTATVSASIGRALTGLVRVVRTAPGPVRGFLPDAPAPSPDACPLLELPAAFVPIGQHFEIRPVNAARPLAGGADPAFDVWIRLRSTAFSHRAFSAPEVAAILLDALPPGLFATLTAPVMIPTAELTAHFTPAASAPDAWFRLRQSTAWATDDLCVDDTTLHTADGTLVAQARQLRRIMH